MKVLILLLGRPFYADSNQRLESIRKANPKPYTLKNKLDRPCNSVHGTPAAQKTSEPRGALH